jgi:hypothetical protein
MIFKNENQARQQGTPEQTAAMSIAYPHLAVYVLLPKII